MKKHLCRSLIIVLFIMFLFPASAFADQDSAATVTLDQALQIAHKYNPDLRIAEMAVEKAQINRDDALENIDVIPVGGLVSPSYQAVVNGYQQAEIALSTAKMTAETQKEVVDQEVISTYAAAVKSYNVLESSRLTLKNVQDQKSIAAMNHSLGLMSDLAYEAFNTSVKQVEEGYAAEQMAYESAMASLRYLLGQSTGWNPALSSRAILTTYSRQELSVELSRGTSQSIQVYAKKALLDIELTKQDWILPNTDEDLERIALNTAELNYEQANRDVRSSIEQSYYGIDALEGQIQVAENTYHLAQTDLVVAKLKYEIGMIPKYSMSSSAESLSAAELAEQKARLSLENLKADLAKLKAAFALLTGQTVYDPADWQQ